MRYREFISEGIKKESPLKAVKGQVILGGDDFLNKISSVIQGMPTSVMSTLFYKCGSLKKKLRNNAEFITLIETGRLGNSKMVNYREK